MFDESIALCRAAGFSLDLLSGDTDSLQIQHLDRWQLSRGDIKNNLLAGCDGTREGGMEGVDDLAANSLETAEPVGEIPGQGTKPPAAAREQASSRSWNSMRLRRHSAGRRSGLSERPDNPVRFRSSPSRHVILRKNLQAKMNRDSSDYLDDYPLLPVHHRRLGQYTRRNRVRCQRSPLTGEQSQRSSMPFGPWMRRSTICSATTPIC